MVNLNLMGSLFVLSLFITDALAWGVGHVTLINATPYDWNLTTSDSYQMDWRFPSIIRAGRSLSYC